MSVTMSYAPVNEPNMHFEAHGEGEPLLLLHGGSGTAEYFSDSVPFFADGFRVIVVELMGHGRRRRRSFVPLPPRPCRSDGHWLSLAAARQNDHPLDAIPIYQRAALVAIDAKNNKGYATAVDYLGRIRQLAQRAGAPALFGDLIVEIRANHKPKRNLMALLDRSRW
jgi:pimeloyl-ACP methyl ester carboxylesterase